MADIKQLEDRANALVARAEAAETQGDWATAGDAWSQVHALAADNGATELAIQTGKRGAEARRRDDRPAATLTLLKAVITLSKRPGSMLGLQLAAALLDCGHLDLAEMTGRQVLEEAPGPLKPLVADTLASVRLIAGDHQGFGQVVSGLDPEANGAEGIGARFRGGQLMRLHGALDDAEEVFSNCAEDLVDLDGAQGAAAAAMTELAELSLFRGHPERALAGFDAAAALWAEVGRRAPLFQVEAGRALCALASGAQTFLPGLLDEPVDFAEERQMPLLEARLRMTRGLCRAAGGSALADADFEAAMLLADTAGARYLAGRIRVERFQALDRAGKGGDVEDLRHAVLLLVGNQPWWNLALLRLSQATQGPDPAGAMRKAATALAGFESMGIDDKAAQARSVVGNTTG